MSRFITFFLLIPGIALLFCFFSVYFITKIYKGPLSSFPHASTHGNNVTECIIKMIPIPDMHKSQVPGHPDN